MLLNKIKFTSGFHTCAPRPVSRRLVQACSAQSNKKPNSASEPSLQNAIRLPPPLSSIAIPNSVYSALCGAVVVAELGLVDAAYSGDWSRIGILSTEQELQLQQAVLIIAAIHGAEAAIAAYLAKGKGVDDVGELLAVALRAFFFGALEINKVSQMEPLR
ncbi:hypothetical protein DUNSADRAFT_15113 [Dunaliella salina]|uniref:DUF7887 domain-containing protein n=1 Tax=Dunaliella salina TaxID=3046 RepID=A0ABQ7H222_DUNSA|nr:hypothetical protein DUNSADRAFT_15113 [Dunaliella salina]|eukprot:KAF5840913.1 hypothetical protein DUNSADRAFT_15113 [Dunaliella salina]